MFFLSQMTVDVLSFTDERADVAYPSLLHFVADLNLRTFCSQLLRYPGMLAAALTENKDGEYPSQIAARKGYTQLESDLLQFVEDHKRKSNLRSFLCNISGLHSTNDSYNKNL